MTTTFVVDQGDVVVSDVSGQPNIVSGGLKFRQDLKEALSIDAKADNIGAGLDSILDGRPSDVFTVRAQISQNIRRAITNMQSLQAQFHRAERSGDERVRQLTAVHVTTVEGGLTDFAFRVEVATIGGARQTVTGVIR